MIGEGGFSTVRLATNRATGAIFAVKSAPHELGHDPTDPSSRDDADMLCDEARVLYKLCHASIIHCYGIQISPRQVLMVLELMEGGNLFDRIVNKATHHYTEAEARRAAFVLLHAVAYLASHGIVHRDLKPENLLLSSSSNDHDFKIADFGLACDLADGTLAAGFAGTAGYVAPEVYDSVEFREHPGYGCSCDVWSSGVIVFALLGGYLPWSAKDEEVHKRRIRTERCRFADSCWDEVSEDAMGLVERLLDYNPRRRIGAAEALNASWFLADSVELRRNTLYRGHANLTNSADEQRDEGVFGERVHAALSTRSDDDDEQTYASSRSSPSRTRARSLTVEVPEKTALHAWSTRAEHGYTTFEDLDLGDEIGVGGFSRVKVATNRVTGARFAVKEAPHKPGHDPATDPDDADMLCSPARARSTRISRNFDRNRSGTRPLKGKCISRRAWFPAQATRRGFYGSSSTRP